jgi:hypothetical protein
MLKKLKELFFGKPAESVQKSVEPSLTAQQESVNNQITDSVTAPKPKRNRRPRKKPAAQNTQPTKQVPVIKTSNSTAPVKSRRKKNTNTTQK